jgi:hypothetical protein
MASTLLKKVIDFPVPSRGMSLTKPSMAGDSLIILGQREFGKVSDIPAGDAKILTFFTVYVLVIQSRKT